MIIGLFLGPSWRHSLVNLLKCCAHQYMCDAVWEQEGALNATRLVAVPGPCKQQLNTPEKIDLLYPTAFLS